MKKTLFLLGILVVGIALTSFATDKQTANKNGDGNEWKYFTTVKAWYSETESTTLYIWYKEGNGVRVYGYVDGSYSSKESTPGWDDFVHNNKLYHSTEYKSFKRNYRYTAGHYVFNGFLPNMQNDYEINGWTYYKDVTAWYSETESALLYIWYKEGHGVRVYGYVDSKYSGQTSTPGWDDMIRLNEDYQSSECRTFRRNYPYKAGIYVLKGNFPNIKL